MKNLYGTIGYTILKNNQTNNNIIVFADRHDNLPKCDNKTNIAEWFKQKIYSSKILLEEVPRNSVELEELWSDSEHTQDLKNLYLNNSQDINGLDIRPLLIPFSWELVTSTEPAHNITTRKYLRKINDFFKVSNSYLSENLSNYNVEKLKDTKLGVHFLLVKNNFKKLLEKNKEFLVFSVQMVKTINSDFFESINNILDQIMEWYICANIMLNNYKPIIIHAGLAHSEKIVELLQVHYQYDKITEKGINKLELTNSDRIEGCMPMPIDTDKQFGGKYLFINLGTQ
jgi:hypothetical protein